MDLEPSSVEADQPEKPVESSIFLEPHQIAASLEALLFIADKPLSLEKLRTVFGFSEEEKLLEESIDQLQQRYLQSRHGIELLEIAGGYQFRTKTEYAFLAKKLVKVQTQRLSSGAMECLAIIAYQQPTMKEQIDQIRGVDSSHFIRNLLEKKLIQITGRSELPGRPMLYATTPEFLQLFGLKDLSSLPALREIEQMIPESESDRPEEEKDPRVREMRKLVAQMKSNTQDQLKYDPKEDEKILQQMRERIQAIPTSCPTLDAMEMAQEQEAVL